MQGDETGILEALKARADPNARDPEHHLTPLHYAALDCLEDAVMQLLEAQAPLALWRKWRRFAKNIFRKVARCSSFSTVLL